MARTTYEYAPGIGVVRTKDQRLIKALGLTPIAKDRFGLPVRETETFEWPTFRPRQPMTRARRNRASERYAKIDESIERGHTAAFKRRRDDAATWGADDSGTSAIDANYPGLGEISNMRYVRSGYELLGLGLERSRQERSVSPVRTKNAASRQPQPTAKPRTILPRHLMAPEDPRLLRRKWR
ncbi:MAG TPA: hypothetical protein PKV96_02225 [Candidatus Saccharimonas sp.]|nr:hypothetical protein [Candidatus Saccharimonas sp.]